MPPTVSDERRRLPQPRGVRRLARRSRSARPLPSGRADGRRGDLRRVDVVDRLDPLDRHVPRRVGGDDLDRVRPRHQRRRGVEAPAVEPRRRRRSPATATASPTLPARSSQPFAVAAGGGASSAISGAAASRTRHEASPRPPPARRGPRPRAATSSPASDAGSVTWKPPPGPTSAWTAGAAVRPEHADARRPRARPRSRRRRSRRCASAAVPRRRAAPPGRARSSRR